MAVIGTAGISLTVLALRLFKVWRFNNMDPFDLERELDSPKWGNQKLAIKTFVKRNLTHHVTSKLIDIIGDPNRRSPHQVDEKEQRRREVIDFKHPPPGLCRQASNHRRAHAARRPSSSPLEGFPYSALKNTQARPEFANQPPGAAIV